MKRFTLLTLLILLSELNAQSVVQGNFRNSFVLTWEKLNNVNDYEYIVTDNPSCTSGCAGDTRQASVKDTSVLIFTTYTNKYYYWRIRPINAGIPDSLNYWSDVRRFLAEPLAELDIDAISISPNPIIGNELNVLVDWNKIPQKESGLSYRIYSVSGNSIDSDLKTCVNYEGDLKQVSYNLNVSLFNKGIYVLEVIHPILGSIEQIKFYKE